ncbi:MAG: TIGR01440 family protein [Bacillota bacterium]|nr:TIGR01440 family protein [Bacillota bacterium]
MSATQSRQLATELRDLLQELAGTARRSGGRRPLLVIGCSTSEIAGQRIGRASQPELAAELAAAALAAAAGLDLDLAVQCCEHLNRALVVERDTALARGLTEVNAVPQNNAGGAFATAIYAGMQDPVLVMNVAADLGLDIGQTLIGMHLKPVAVPVRLAAGRLGEAVLTAARTRPPSIGGERAHYNPALR